MEGLILDEELIHALADLDEETNDITKLFEICQMLKEQMLIPEEKS